MEKAMTFLAFVFAALRTIPVLALCVLFAAVAWAVFVPFFKAVFILLS